MKNDHKNIDIIDPKNQLNLFGYEDYFSLFIELFVKKDYHIYQLKFHLYYVYQSDFHQKF